MFGSAVANYRAHEHKGAFGTVGESSLTGLVVRFGDSMPPKLALEAIDEILSKARKNEDKFSVTVGGGRRAVRQPSKFQL